MWEKRRKGRKEQEKENTIRKIGVICIMLKYCAGKVKLEQRERKVIGGNIGNVEYYSRGNEK